MAATIDFAVWAGTATIGPDCTSSTDLANESYFQSGGDIFHNIFNGIFRDVSLVTVSLIKALVNSAGTAGDSMTFNNAQTEADTISNIETLLYSRNVKSADKAGKWSSPITLMLTDGFSNTSSVSFDGSVASITLTIPDELVLTELTINRIYVDSLYANGVNSYITAISEIMPGQDDTLRLGATNRRWKNIFATKFTGDLSGSASKVACKQVTTTATIHYLTAVTTSADGDKEIKALSELSYKPSTDTLNCNISGNAATASVASAFAYDSFQHIYGNGTAAATVVVTGFKHDMKAIYFVTYDFNESGSHLYSMSTVIFKDTGTGDGTSIAYAGDRRGNIFALRLKFQYRDRTTNHNVYLQYSNDGGTTWTNCTDEYIINIDRILCQ